MLNTIWGTIEIKLTQRSKHNKHVAVIVYGLYKEFKMPWGKGEYEEIYIDNLSLWSYTLHNYSLQYRLNNSLRDNVSMVQLKLKYI